MPRRPRGKSRRTEVPTRPLNPDQAVSPYTAAYLSHQRMIGRVVVAWSALEGCLQQIIWEFLNISMSDGRIITSRLDASSMIPMVRALGMRNLVPDRVQEFLDLLATVDGYRNDRNFIVHGQWLVLEPQNVPIAMSLRPEAEAGSVVSETFPNHRLNEIVHAIEDCRKRLLILEAELRTSRDKLLQRHPKD